MPNEQERPRPGRRAQHLDTDLERTGATLRQFRIYAGKTRDELATAIGFRYGASITQIEQGTKGLTDDKLIEAAKFLGVDPLAIRRTKGAA